MASARSEASGAADAPSFRRARRQEPLLDFTETAARDCGPPRPHSCRPATPSPPVTRPFGRAHLDRSSPVASLRRGNSKQPARGGALFVLEPRPQHPRPCRRAQGTHTLEIRTRPACQMNMLAALQACPHTYSCHPLIAPTFGHGLQLMLAAPAQRALPNLSTMLLQGGVRRNPVGASVHRKGGRRRPLGAGRRDDGHARRRSRPATCCHGRVSAVLLNPGQMRRRAVEHPLRRLSHGERSLMLPEQPLVSRGGRNPATAAGAGLPGAGGRQVPGPGAAETTPQVMQRSSGQRKQATIGGGGGAGRRAVTGVELEGQRHAGFAGAAALDAGQRFDLLLRQRQPGRLLVNVLVVLARKPRRMLRQAG